MLNSIKTLLISCTITTITQQRRSHLALKSPLQLRQKWKSRMRHFVVTPLECWRAKGVTEPSAHKLQNEPRQ